METVVTIEVTCPACGDMFQTIFDASEEAARIAALEAENAELKARLERIQSLYNQAAQTIRNQSETIRRNESRDFVGID